MSIADMNPLADVTRKPGTRFRDGPHLPEMVVVASGKFWMGADESVDKFANTVEKPRHWVEINYPLAVGRRPVTFAEWDEFVNCEPEMHRPEDRGWGRGELPVVNVSWEDAQCYVSWLSANTGRSYRLLSESEWEYCCRAGTNGIFSTGDGIDVKQANFLYMDFGDKPGVGHPVNAGSYEANSFGLCDMHGNVCQLVADAWHDNYSGAPTDGSPWGETADMWRVVRGGGWDALPRILRAAFRDWVHHTQRLDNMGFRVACDIE
jgi:formylglycine-generating enzyme required for sulfatase activity